MYLGQSEWSEFDLAKRDSIISVQSTGRLLDKLELDDEDFISGKYSKPERRRSKPLSRGLSLALQRVSDDPQRGSVARQKSSKGAQLQAMLSRARSVDVKPGKDHRMDTLKGNFGQRPVQSKDGVQGDSEVGPIPETDPSRVHEPPLKSVQLRAVLSQNNRSYDSFVADVREALPESTSAGAHARSASDSFKRSVSDNYTGNNSAQRTPSTPTRRIISESGATNMSPSSHDTDPELRIASALQLRAVGRHREALYQLQIAANGPYFHCRAMYLYALALHVGQGVKQNDLGAAKWLCRGVLTGGGANETSQQKYSELSAEALLTVVAASLKREPTVDPLVLHRVFSEFSQHKLSRMSKDPIAACYHELGSFLIHGYGLKKDEPMGMTLWAKAGSMGHVASMVELGELWSVKTKYHKKDYRQAAAWFRIGELFGHQTMGNSWIYKEKYM